MQRCCMFVCLFVCVIQMLGKECGNACRRVGGWTEVKQMIRVSDRPKSTFVINVIFDLNILDIYIYILDIISLIVTFLDMIILDINMDG